MDIEVRLLDVPLYPPKANMDRHDRDVCFVPEADITPFSQIRVAILSLLRGFQPDCPKV